MSTFPLAPELPAALFSSLLAVCRGEVIDRATAGELALRGLVIELAGDIVLAPRLQVHNINVQPVIRTLDWHEMDDASQWRVIEACQAAGFDRSGLSTREIYSKLDEADDDLRLRELVLGEDYGHARSQIGNGQYHLRADSYEVTAP